MKEAQIIKKITKFAEEVYSTLGAGYNEAVYEEALGVELRNAKIDYEVQHSTEIMYKKAKVGTHRLDFIIDGKVVVELKSSASISKGNRSQLIAYLRTLGLKKGLIINFPYPDADTPQIEEVSADK
jgi:GxxExxY protein